MEDFDLEQIVARLRRQGTDDSEVEVKECAASLSKDIWETVSAFANTSGGLIVLGISERNGFAPVADFDINRVREQFVAGMGDGGSRGKLVNPPRYSISRAFLDSCPVLVIEIEELPLSQSPAICLAAVPGLATSASTTRTFSSQATSSSRLPPHRSGPLLTALPLPVPCHLTSTTAWSREPLLAP